ncbi:MAG TPA: diacylglycerol kinase family protein [Pseudomonadales bacterium]|nr:diacylglycerol kinase family protein [Pseudomonadales bacterium]
MNRLAILSNAGSGRNQRKAARLARLDGLSGVHQCVTNSAAQVPAALVELLREAPDLLVINGGDGSVQEALTVLHAMGRCAPAQALPPIAVLPAGSTNMIAGDLGCGGRFERRLAEVLALRDRPRARWNVKTRSPLLVTDAAGVERLGFFFGMGTIVRGIDYWHRSLAHGGGAGEWGAGAALLRAAWGIARREPPFAEPAHVRLEIDGGPPQARDLMFLLVTPMRRLFLGLTPFWGPGDGPLSLTWVDDRPRRFVRRVPALLRGRAERLPEADGFHGRRPASVVVELDEAWVIDGEVVAAPGRLTLSAAPPMAFVHLAPEPGR